MPGAAAEMRNPQRGSRAAAQVGNHPLRVDFLRLLLISFSATPDVPSAQDWCAGDRSWEELEGVTADWLPHLCGRPRAWADVVLASKMYNQLPAKKHRPRQRGEAMVAHDARLMHDSLIMANLPPEMLALFGQYTC